MSRHSHHPHRRSRATQWCSCRGRRELVEWLGQTKAHNSSSVACTPACEMLDGVASLAACGVAAAFFTSLELCSCIYLDTKDGPVEPSLLPFVTDRRRLQRDASAGDEKKSGGGAKPSCFSSC
ncbi:hypothetical protein ACJRO7_031181 [Eucalyptus globulus]|uniref:Uncharacterized protein n=1 Tax=Eucalyptus globulus TaxID=34317 RepID=A0ABD3JI29_EUCGL